MNQQDFNFDLIILELSASLFQQSLKEENISTWQGSDNIQISLMLNSIITVPCITVV